MFVLSMIAFFGVGLTAAVEAQASESFQSMEINSERFSVYEFGQGAHNSLIKKESVETVEPALWKKVRQEKEVLSFNVTLGVTYQGEMYDLSLGDVESSQLFDQTGYTSDNERPRYAFVGVSVGW